MIGTWASWRMSGRSPPSSVAPQPTIVSIVAADQMLRSAAPATLTGPWLDGLVSLRIETSEPLVSRYCGGIVTLVTVARSPSVCVRPPILTSISAAGQAIGDDTAAPVTELQWPAVRTVSGAISVPVQRNALYVTSATAGYSPGSASSPPTTASDGDAVCASATHVSASSNDKRFTNIRPPPEK